MDPLPRSGSLVYNIKFGDDKALNRTLRLWKFINKFFIVPLARMRLIPLLGLKNIFIVISVIGRKSMKRWYAGLSLRKIDDRMFVFIARGKKTQWLKNHIANPDKTFIYYGFQRYRARLELLRKEEKLTVMSKYVKKHPRRAKLGIGWDEYKDDPDGELLKQYVATIEIAEIILKKI